MSGFLRFAGEQSDRMNNPEHLYHKAFRGRLSKATTSSPWSSWASFRHPAIAKAHHLSATCCTRMGDFQRAPAACLGPPSSTRPTTRRHGGCWDGSPAQTDQHDLAIEESG